MPVPVALRVTNVDAIENMEVLNINAKAVTSYTLVYEDISYSMQTDNKDTARKTERSK